MRRSKPPPDTAANGSMQAEQRFGWFGKLPAAGDFVARRLPYPVQQFWDGWCAQGMEALKASRTATGVLVWGGTPHWGFLVPAQPGVAGAQFGLFAPSCDRVGRVFPFVVAAPLQAAQQAAVLKRAALVVLAWSDVVSRAQQARLGLDELDAGLHVAFVESLGSEPGEGLGDDDGATLPQQLDPAWLPWSDLGDRFDAQGELSHWWSVPAPGAGLQIRVQTGTLRTTHFLELCR